MFEPLRPSELPNTNSLEESDIRVQVIANFKWPAAMKRSCVSSCEVPVIFIRLQTKFGAVG